MRDFLRLISALALLRLAADMLLPSGESAKLTDFGVGLCMTLCILEKITSLMRGNL